MTDHALGQQAGERFVNIQVSTFAKGAGEKPGIQKMQHGVLDAANVLVHRKPVIGSRLGESDVVNLGRCEAREIP